MTPHRHHIIPVSLGGSDSEKNVVYVTPQEHYQLHYERYVLYGLGVDARACNLLKRFCGVDAEKYLNYKHSKETRDKISKSNIGSTNARKRWDSMTPEKLAIVSDKISKSKTGKPNIIRPSSKQYLVNENRTEAQQEKSRQHSLKMKGRAPWNKKGIVINGIEYDTVRDAMKQLKVGYLKLKEMV
jgi:hypothetical protein